MDMSENEELDNAIAHVVAALGIEPMAVAVSGRMTALGLELRLLIIPYPNGERESTEPEPESQESRPGEPESEAEREMREKVDQLFS